VAITSGVAPFTAAAAGHPEQTPLALQVFDDPQGEDTFLS
jgi:hypothetical protein